MPVTVLRPTTPNGRGPARYADELLSALLAASVHAKARDVGPRGRLLAGLRTLRSKRVVHAADPACNPRLRKADVVTVHDAIAVAHPEFDGLSARQHGRHNRQVARALRRHVITPSEHVRAELLRLFPAAAEPSRIHAIPNGVDSTRFYPDPGRHKALRLGMLNVAIVMDAGPLDRVDALLGAAIAVPYTNVIHVGTPIPDAGRLRKEGRYQPLGKLRDEDLRRILSSADLVCHPRVATGSARVPLEALACGARVLASDVPAHREALGEAVRYFEPTGPALADALESSWNGTMVEDAAYPPFQARLDHAARFDWADTARKTLDVYRQVPGKSV